MLARRHLGEDPDGALAGGVRGLLVERLADAGHRRDVHDRAAAGPAHRGDGVLRAEEDAAGVDRHHAVPLLDRAILDRDARDDDRGVVDQDVQLAEAPGRGLDRGLPIRFVRDVEVHVDGLTAVGADGGLDLLALGVPDVAEDHLRAFAGEGLGLGGALSSRAAADQRDLPVQLSHVDPLFVTARFSAWVPGAWRPSASQCPDDG